MKTQASMRTRFLQLEEPEIATTSTPIQKATELELLAVLHAPLEPNEPASFGYDRKEREIGTVFARLPPIEAWDLHRRLANPKAGDVLAAEFERLVRPRRLRLLAFLADPKRRAALSRRP